MTEFNDRVRRKVAEMHDEISALRKENDHLIQAIEDLHDVSLEDRLVQLENENAKLREELADARQIMADELEKQISDYRARHIEQAGTITELESENAELRELVRQMAYAISPTSREHMLANLAEQGIEVDG